MGMSSSVVTSKKFKEFLISRFNFDPLNKYIVEQRGFSLDFFLANTPPVDYIGVGFDWHETDEGFEYWRMLNKQWLMELKNE